MAITIKTPVSQSGINKDVDDTLNSDNKTGNDPNKDSTPPIPDTTSDTTPDTQEEEVVVVDEKEYKVDSEGNALDSDGKVYMSKEDLDKLENASQDQDDSKEDEEDNSEESTATISDLEKLSGIEVIDRDGNKVEFDFTLEGLAQREKQIKDLGLNEGRNKAITDFFNANPDLYKAYIHKQTKGTLEGFDSKPFYKSLELDTTNEEQLMQLVIDAEVKKGRDPERAKKYAQYCKAENTLEEEAKISHDYLVELEDKEVNTFEQSKQQALQKQIELEKNYYGTYYENGKEVIVDTPGSIYNKVVTKGQIGNLVIPQEGIKVKKGDGSVQTLSRRQIFDYVATPVDEHNRTQAEIDMSKKFKDTDYMLRQYMMFLTGNDMSVFLEREVLNQKSKSIKRNLKTRTSSTNKDINKPTSKNLKLPV